MAVYDLLIRGGTVIDPSQNIHASPLDVGISGGQITAVAANIDQGQATTVYDATGKYVVPGLIDLLAHPWPQRNPLGILPDTLMANECTTTIVSPGDPGPGMVYAFRKEVVEPSQCRVYAYVMISAMGYSLWPQTECPNHLYLNAKDAAGAMIGNSDIIVGCKVRPSELIVGSYGIPAVEIALDAVTQAEAATGKTFRVVVHTGAMQTPQILPQVIDLLRPGDVITHCFDGTPNGHSQATGLAQAFSVIQAAYTAKTKGVILDVGWGGHPAGVKAVGGSCDYLTAAICMLPMINGKKVSNMAGIRPDTLSSDSHAFGNANMHLTEVMANMLALNSPSHINYSPFKSLPDLSPAITLDDVVTWTTYAPAQVINRVPLLGTLQLGAPADVAVLQVVNGSFTLNDTFGRTLAASQKILPVQAIKSGVVI